MQVITFSCVFAGLFLLVCARSQNLVRNLIEDLDDAEKEEMDNTIEDSIAGNENEKSELDPAVNGENEELVEKDKVEPNKMNENLFRKPLQENDENVLNNAEAKNKFGSVLENVKKATQELERAVNEGKIDMVKALNINDLQNIVSSFENVN